MMVGYVRSVGTVTLGLVLLVLVASGLVLGEEESGTTKLEAGDSLAVSIDNPTGEDLWVEYTVRVIEGPNVNVWILDEAGHRAYFDENISRFSYYKDGSVEETTYLEESFSWDEAGTVYVVIDNEFNAAENQSAWVEYTVTWEVYEYDSTLLFMLIAVIVLIVVVTVIVITFFSLKRVQLMAQAKQAEEERVGEPRANDARAGEDQVVDDGRPPPPKPYPESVVAASMRGRDDDDATGWDPDRDEPED